jgi:hypothetical protein
MTDVTDLTLYKNKAYLELCLDLIEDVHASIHNGRYDIAENQLDDIIEVFDRHQLAKEEVSYNANVYFLELKEKHQ